MNVAELAKILDAKVLNPEADTAKEVKSGYVCDLLSWVMAKGAPGTAWITVMNHMNVIAVATLLDMACGILPENIDIGEETLSRATEEDIPVLCSGKTSYELAGLLFAQGIPNPVK